MADATRIGAWSVKGVDRATRDLARQASQAAGQTIGGWIEQAIRAQDVLLPSGGAAPAPAEPAEASPPVAGPAAPVDVRALAQEVEQAESRAGDLVIPVALKVQQLAKRLIDIEQARVDGRSPTPEPARPGPPGLQPRDSAAVGASTPDFDAADLPQETRFPEDAWSDDPPLGRDEKQREDRLADSWDAPAPTWDLDPEPMERGSGRRPDPGLAEDLAGDPERSEAPPPLHFDDRTQPPPVEEPPPVFELETPAPALSPSGRAGDRARSRKPPRRARSVRAAIGRTLAAGLALALGAATAIVLLNEGKRFGLPPHLDIEIARRIDQGLAQGRALWSEGGDLASSWAERMMVELDRLMAEAPPPLERADPSAGTQSSGLPGAPPVAPSAAPSAASSGAPPSAPSSGRDLPAPPETPPTSEAAPPLPSSAAEPPATQSSAPEPSVPAGDASVPQASQTAALPPGADISSAAEPAREPPLEPALGDTKRADLPPERPIESVAAGAGAGAGVGASAGAGPAGSLASAPAAPDPGGVGDSAAPARAPEALEKAGRQGDVGAQYELGVLAAQPESGAPDYGKAAYWFREAAVQGNSSAQYNLGVLYEHGMGVGQDDVRALLWYHSAAEQGHSRAQYNLGVFYAQGRGIPTDYPEAQRWFKKAADQGIAKAFYNLAILAESGLGAPANPSAAKAYMSRAALLGDPQARAALTEPPKRGAARADARPEAAARNPSVELVGAIQHLLSEQGYEIGRIDGVLGDKTRQAIRRFQAENGLGQTGTPSDELLDMLSRRVERDTAAAKTPS